MRREVQNMLIYSGLLMVALLLPSFLGNQDPLVGTCVNLIVELLIAFIIFNQLSRAGAFTRDFQEPNWKNLAILSPVILILFALPVALIFDKSMVVIFLNFDAMYFFLTLLTIVLRVLIEEMIFRISLQKRLRYPSKAKRVIISAGIYALFDVLLFFQTFNVLYVLFSMAVSFVMGLIYGAIMEYGHSVYPCMILHFIYDFIGYYFAGLIFIGSELFDLLHLIFPAVSAVYLVIIYFVYYRKKEINYV